MGEAASLSFRPCGMDIAGKPFLVVSTSVSASMLRVLAGDHDLDGTASPTSSVITPTVWHQSSGVGSLNHGASSKN
eukprot:Skav228765  [mRNA]  locus=scaffold589:426600:426827:- [translate_table: standard]